MSARGVGRPTSLVSQRNLSPARQISNGVFTRLSILHSKCVIKGGWRRGGAPGSSLCFPYDGPAFISGLIGPSCCLVGAETTGCRCFGSSPVRPAERGCLISWILRSFLAPARDRPSYTAALATSGRCSSRWGCVFPFWSPGACTVGRGWLFTCLGMMFRLWASVAARLSACARSVGLLRPSPSCVAYRSVGRNEKLR